jgi:hypothetical protein
MRDWALRAFGIGTIVFIGYQFYLAAFVGIILVGPVPHPHYATFHDQPYAFSFSVVVFAMLMLFLGFGLWADL